MRTRLSWVLTALGALSAVAGLALMVILGPDSRFSTGPHEVVSDGIAVVTAPKVITWADVRIDVLAEVPVQKPVFVGLGNSVDVQNYVSATARLEVTDFHTPWEIKTRQIEGKPGLPGAPTALDCGWRSRLVVAVPASRPLSPTRPCRWRSFRWATAPCQGSR